MSKKTSVILSLLVFTLVLATITTASANEPDTVAVWHFDEGTGSTAADATGNGNDGTLSGGRFGNALYFDGDDYIEIGNTGTLDVTDSYSFEAWVYLESEGTVDQGMLYRGIFRRGAIGFSASELEIYTQPYGSGYTGKLTVAHNRGDGTFGYRYFTPFPLDQWVHLAVTYDGTTSRAYYNNVEQTSSSTTVQDAVDTVNPSYIGIGYYNAYMKGKIDEMRISSTPHTSFDISSPLKVEDDTLALWHFDESEGTTIKDETTNNNVGTIYGATWAGPVWVDGLYGKGLEFTGDYVFVDGSAPELSGMSEVTVETWFYLNDYPAATGHSALVTKWYQSTSYDTYGLWISGAHKLVGGLGPQVEMGIVGTTDIPLNTWHHAALVYDSTTGTVDLYLDGKLEATMGGKSGDLNSGNNPLFIGSDYNGIANPSYQWRYLDGIIDETRVWDTALSPETVKAHANGLVGEWDFDEGSGSTAYDSSGFENHGTIVAATWEPGRYETGLTYNDIDYVQINDAYSLDFDDEEDMTIEAWVKTEYGSGNEMVIAKRGAGTDVNENCYVLYMNTGGSAVFYLRDSPTNAVSVASLTKINDGTWHHIAGVRDTVTGKARIFIDGVLERELTDPTGDLSNNYPLLIGRQGGYGQSWRGQIDEVKIWSQALVPVMFTEIGLEGDSTGTVVTVADPIPLAEAELPYVMMVKPGTQVSFNYESQVETSSTKYYTREGVSTSTPVTVSSATIVAGTYASHTAPVADANGPYIADEGIEVTLDGSGSNDPEDDIVLYEWDFESDGTYDYSSSTTATSSHTWNDDFDGTVTLRVTDNDGFTSLSTSSVKINNVAPTITDISGPTAPIDIVTVVELEVTFTDPGTDTHTASVDWGDKVPIDPEITNDVISPATLPHTYAEAGVYTVTVTITDDDGGSDSEVYEHYIIIYDPSEGFVTGGGWIDSPKGAYRDSVDLEGKATFGFVSKYKKGATVPTGNTEFVFKAGGLNFHSSSYDWLVIAGGSKAQYKGVGSINGEGEYKFMITAIDSDIDSFRIKIWTETDAGVESVIYDNKIGEAPETTDLGGGSIVIHTPKTK